MQLKKRLKEELDNETKEINIIIIIIIIIIIVSITKYLNMIGS